MEGTLTSGVKYASGTSSVNGSSTFTYVNGQTGSFSYTEIQLDFQPSTILVTGTQGTAYEVCSIYNSISKGSQARTVKSHRQNTSIASYSGQNFKIDKYVEPGGNVYRIPLNQSTSENITWEAYGYPPN